MGKRQPITEAPITIYMVGQMIKLCSLNPYHLVDLEELDRPLLSIMGCHNRQDIGDSAWSKINYIHTHVLDLMGKDYEKNYLVTNSLFMNTHDEVIFHQVKRMADNRGSLFLPVLLLSNNQAYHPLARELKESSYHLVLEPHKPEEVIKTILAYAQKMVDDFNAQPDLIYDEVIIDESDNPGPRAIIKNGVIEYNRRFLGDWKPKPFSLYIRNAEGNIIAGICGDYISAYTRVNWAWVNESYRGRGLGRRAMLAVEEFAHEKGCRFVQLDTMDFQAKPFYQKLGFHVVATLADWVNGHDCYILRKQI